MRVQAHAGVSVHRTLLRGSPSMELHRLFCLGCHCTCRVATLYALRLLHETVRSVKLLALKSCNILLLLSAVMVGHGSIPKLPSSAEEVDWDNFKVGGANRNKTDDAASRGGKDADDAANIRRILETQHNINCDITSLQRCLRGIKLSLDGIKYESSEATKRKHKALAKQQDAVEYYMASLLEDSEKLDAVVRTLIARDKADAISATSAGAPAPAAGGDTVEQSVATLHRLYTKYDERRWKTYVETPMGRVLR
eukprot:m.1016846 g.1016846  ORF g.1016846 m.1016846 type:complete len:253 (-) comp24083_c0_seq1:364-1122(-)